MENIYYRHQIKNLAKSKHSNAPWGTVSYIICNSKDDIKMAERFVKHKSKDGINVYVIPESPIDILDVSLEIEALLSLKNNQELTSSDPLIESELNELLDVARESLNIAIHRLTSQRPTSTNWYFDGEPLVVDKFRPASMAISNIMDDYFSKTPKIVNVQIMRQNLSRQMNTHRNRFITQLLEHAKSPTLGFDEKDGSPSASIYQTVLQQTGLHIINDKGEGCFASPRDLEDPGLREVWQHLQEFFTTPGIKPLESIVNPLDS